MTDFCIEDLFQQTVLAELHGAARHPRVVWSAARARPDNRYASTVWMLDRASNEGPRALTTPDVPSGSPVLDPGGDTLAFLSARRGDTRQVHLLRLDGGEAFQLGESCHELQAIQVWSPDGAHLLLTARQPWAEDALDDPAGADRPWVVTYLPYKSDGSGVQVGKRSVVLAMNTDSGEERVLIAGDFDVAEAAWSPDGQSIAFVRTREGRQRHLLDVWLADADGLHPRQLTRTLASVGGLVWSPDGRTLALGGSAGEGDSMSELWLLDVATETLQRPVEDMQLEGNAIVWHREGDRLATIAARRGLQEIVVVERAGGAVTRLDAGLQQASALTAAGDRLAFVAARMDRPDEVHVLDWEGADECVRSCFNREWVADRALPRVEKRSFHVPDGEGGSEEIEAWLLRPAEGDGPFPLLVDLHGGPRVMC